jgi:hypothetical protein
MFKSFTLVALVAAASAQFLGRDLQNLQQALTSLPPNNVTVATAFTTCTTNATFDSCPGLYCCGNLRRAGAAVTTAAAVCVPLNFANVTFNVSNVLNVWNCNNQVNTAAFRNLTASRVACTDDSVCTPGSCCATFTDSFGPAATPAIVQNRRFCLDGSANGTQSWGSYASTNVGAGWESRVVQGSCTNVAVPESFGAYIKASAMMLVALISVALF